MTHITLDQELTLFRTWVAEICDAVFRLTDPVPLDLRFGFDPKSDADELLLMGKKAAEFEDTDPLDPLTFGLSLLPINVRDIFSLSGFWTVLRNAAELHPGHKKLVFYTLLSRRDVALARATQLALFQQMCQEDPEYALTTPTLRHAAAEARMDLRRAEFSLIAFNIRLGVTKFIESSPVLFLLAASLFKIRVYHYDLAMVLLATLGESSKKRYRKTVFSPFLEGTARSSLLATQPSRADSAVTLCKHIAHHMDFLTGFYENGLGAAYKTVSGRYVWAEEELETLVHLHDMCVKCFDQALII